MSDRRVYEAAMRRRGRQRRRLETRREANTIGTDGATEAAGVPGYAPTLFGARLWSHQLADFRRCAEALGGEWLTFTSADRRTDYVFLSTVDCCEGRPWCHTDHHEAGRKLLADLHVFLAKFSHAIIVEHSRGWRTPGPSAAVA